MTHSFIPTSQELVRQTRAAWGLTKADFGPKLGVTGEFAGQVEFGKKVFGDENIAAGLTHSAAEVRQFWLDYWTARQREQQHAIIENCIENSGA